MDKRRIDRLLSDVQEGSDEAFEALYREARNAVFSFLYSYYQNYHDAEDAMQSVFLKVKLRIGQYTPGTNGSAWMLQIAKHHALDELRARRPSVALDEAPEVSEPFEDGGIMDLMRRTLSEEEQRVVTMYVLWGWKHRQIAKALDCPTGTVTSKYKRALEKLKKAVKEVL